MGVKRKFAPRKRTKIGDLGTSIKQEFQLPSIFRDADALARMDSHIASDRNATRMRAELEQLGVNLDFVKKFALLTCGTEGKLVHKKARGKIVPTMLEKMITGYEFGAEFFRNSVELLPVHSPQHSQAQQLQAANQELLEFAKATLNRATEPGSAGEPLPFETQCFGTVWNGNYLFDLRGYIARVTGWADEDVLSAVTQFITAALIATGAPRNAHLGYNSSVRDRIREALHNFESNKKNRLTIQKQTHLLDRLCSAAASQAKSN